MAAEFKIDTIVLNGQVVTFEDSSGMISGVTGFENEPVLAASGDDSTKRKRVERVLKAKLSTRAGFDAKGLGDMKDIQIAMRDSLSNRKCLANVCTFKKLGDVGNGTAEVEFLLLTDLQWL